MTETNKPAAEIEDAGTSSSVTRDAWQRLSSFTAARIAQGRAGVSLPTGALLEFAADHARARDAIHTAFDRGQLQRTFAAAAFDAVAVASEATTRSDYLRRPDLGRRLDRQSRALLSVVDASAGRRLTIVVADGLSPLAAQRNALPLLERLRAALAETWELDRIVVATQARVALGDEVGELRGAEAVLVLIGERPGLKSPDSLSAYLTYRPRLGTRDSERNCVSNIRTGGLGVDEAASRIVHLLTGARELGASGVALKEDRPAALDQPQ